MGYLSSVRCRLCGGTGKLDLKELPHILLYEWIEGYSNDEESDEWLEEHLRRLINVRKKERKERSEMSVSLQDDDSDLIDEDPPEDEDEDEDFDDSGSMHPRYFQYP